MKFISKYFTSYFIIGLFFVFFIEKPSFALTEITAEEICLNGSDSCSKIFTTNNEEMIIGSGGNLDLRGTLIGLSDSGIIDLTPSAKAFVLDDGITGAILRINADNGEGINMSKTNKSGAAVYSKLGTSFATIEVNSGKISSTDTAIFLTDSDLAGTDIVVKEGATIQGSRFAIRQDTYDTYPQNSSGLGSNPPENDGSSSVPLGTLNLRVNNSGIISADQQLISRPFNEGSTQGYSFYIGGEDRIATNLKITNNSTGEIYGKMFFGFRVFDSNYKDKDYVKSEILIENDGLISTEAISNNFDTKLTIVNRGDILLQSSPIGTSGFYEVFNDFNLIDSDSDGFYEYSFENDLGDTVSGELTINPTYIAESPDKIKLQSDDDSITNYGKIVGDINSFRDSQNINLFGGSYTGEIIFAGNINFGNDLEKNAIIADFITRTDRYTDIGKSRIDIGTKDYNIAAGSGYNGDFLISVSGSDEPTISTTFTNDGTLGRLNFQGNTVIPTGVKFNINTLENYSYLKSGYEYTVIDGNSAEITGTSFDNDTSTSSGSNVKKVQDENITINDVATNTIGLLTFHTEARDADSIADDTYHDLVLIANRRTDFTNNKIATEIFKTIDIIGSEATGELKALQKYVDLTEKDSDREDALISSSSTNNANLELVTMVPIHKFLEATNRRFDSLLISRNKDNSSTSSKHYSKYNKDKYGRALVFCSPSKKSKYKFINSDSGEIYESEIKNNLNTTAIIKNESEKEAIKSYCISRADFENDNNNLISQDKFAKETKEKASWGQVFGAASTRDGENSYSGYNADTAGFAIGGDIEIDKKSVIGVAVSYAKSNITSDNKSRKSDVDTYQANLYGGRFYDNNSFWDAILGIAWNEYVSRRSISAVNNTATASYNGQDYIARLRGGIVYDRIRNSNFDIIPEISATFVHREIGSYTEEEAGTLNLAVDATKDQYLEGRIGYNISHKKSGKKIDRNIRFHNSYGYNFLNKKRTTVSQFIGHQEKNTVISDADGASTLRFGIGIDLTKINQSNILSLDYNLDMMSNYISHSGSLRIRHEF